MHAAGPGVLTKMVPIFRANSGSQAAAMPTPPMAVDGP